jgi:DNA-binding CsgD family transcriptional regulator
MLGSAAVAELAGVVGVLSVGFALLYGRGHLPGGGRPAEGDPELAAALRLEPRQLAGLSPEAVRALRAQLVLDGATGLLRREVGLVLLDRLLAELSGDATVAAAAIAVPADPSGERSDAALTALLRSPELALGGLLAFRLDGASAFLVAPGRPQSELDGRVVPVAKRLGATVTSCELRAGASADSTVQKIQRGLRRARVDDVAGKLLTPREQEVARLVAMGYSNPRIAQRLYVSRDTVNTHVKNILAKLGYRSRSQIAAYWATQAQRAVDGIQAQRAAAAGEDSSSRTA